MPHPLIISTWSFGARGNESAWPALIKGGSSLDAVERACQAVELDPDVDSVGFGGLPDAAGHVSLDGCIMVGPGVGCCGSVCCLRRHMHPVSIARRVMECTPHVMLAGDGADAFALAQGFLPADLLAAGAQDAWNQWRAGAPAGDQSRDRALDPGGAPRRPSPRPIDCPEVAGGRLYFHPGPQARPSRDESQWKHHDTIGVLAIDGRGVMAGACSTSGTPFKMPGRVGDSPIIGHGLYVDPAAGAAVATGTGELIMGVCAAFLAVEFLRQGRPPVEALRATLQRMIDAQRPQPEHQAALIAMRPDGSWASAALRDGYRTSVRDAQRNEVVEPDLVVLS